jgi:hypothetical protein
VRRISTEIVNQLVLADPKPRIGFRVEIGNAQFDLASASGENEARSIFALFTFEYIDGMPTLIRILGRLGIHLNCFNNIIIVEVQIVIEFIVRLT